MSLQSTSVTSAYPLLPSQVVSICDLQSLALYRFHTPGLQLDNEVSQSTDQPHGTVSQEGRYVDFTAGRFRFLLHVPLQGGPKLDVTLFA